MHHMKIVKFAPGGSISDFVKDELYDLMPLGGDHVDAAVHSVGDSTDAGKQHRPELLHFGGRQSRGLHN
jgi:hypothetical protein